MKKRILSVFLTLVMVLCLAPMTTFAEGESETATVTVASVQALIDALPDASSIGTNDVAGVLTKLKAIDDAAPRLSNDDYNKLKDNRYHNAIVQLQNLAVEVKNESELKQQIAKGGSIKLSEGITLTEDLTVSSGVFLWGASFNGDYGIIIETNAFLCECNSSNITITNNGGTVWCGSYKSVINQNGGVVYQASASDMIKNNGGTVNGGQSKSVISEGGVLFQVRATDGDIIMKGDGTVSYSFTENGDISNVGGTMNEVAADSGSVENKPGGGSKIATIKKVTAANLYNDKGGTIEDCTVVSDIDNDGGTIKKGNFEKASKVENKDNGVISGSTFGVNCRVYNSGTISDSTFNGKVNYTGIFTNCIFSGTSAVTNEQGGTIGEGTFAGTVTNNGTISDGHMKVQGR